MAKEQEDYTAGPEALLKQFGKVEGSALSPQAEGAAAPGLARTARALTGVPITDAEKARAAMETDADRRRQETAAAQQNTTTRQVAGAEGTARTTQENATSLLQELNNKMAQLIKITAQNEANTAETVAATRGLSKDLFRSI